MTVVPAVAQVLPALAGAVLGLFPGGWALLAAINAITGRRCQRRIASMGHSNGSRAASPTRLR
jgi:hypothetical protein